MADNPFRYYHVTVRVTPYACRSYTKHLVISEDVLSFIERNRAVKRHGGEFDVQQYREIDEATYQQARKFNEILGDPLSTVQVAHLKAEDWGTFDGR